MQRKVPTQTKKEHRQRRALGEQATTYVLAQRALLPQHRGKGWTTVVEGLGSGDDGGGGGGVVVVELEVEWAGGGGGV